MASLTLNELKARAAIVSGAGLLAVIGRERFYRLAQDRTSVLGRIASAFCRGHAGRICSNYAIFSAEKDKERINDVLLRCYSDDGVFGDSDTDADGKPLLEQERGLIVPLVERAIASDHPSAVLEIGTANGDIISHLAGCYPSINFIGVDLSVATAQRKHSRPNLRFVKGYALDILRRGEVPTEFVYASSTFCAFVPRELSAYMAELARARRVILSDPVRFGNVHTRDPQPKSRHMDLYMWWHNYFGYTPTH
jgi:Methyltransferase domain